MTIRVNEKIEVSTPDIFRLIPFVLIENAIKYSPINIDQDIEIKESITCEGLDIYISSQGPKIEEDEFKKIFDPFYRGRAAKEDDGSGVGLFAAKKISTMLEIGLEAKQSERSFGFNEREYFDTTFTISIPKKILSNKKC